MLNIEKIISRDIPLINIYAWHRGYTTGMKKWLGWSYTDTLFYVHDNYVDIMRPSSDHLVKFRNILYKKADGGPDWFKTESKIFISLVKEIMEFYKKALLDVETCSADDVWSIYERYVAYITRVMGPFISMIWLPMFCEHDKYLQKKYQLALKLAIVARKKSELVFPLGDELIMKIIARIALESGLSHQLLKNMDYQEFREYLLHQSKLRPALLLRRAHGFIYSKKGILMVNKRQGAERAFSLLGYTYKHDDLKITGRLTGSSACPGLAKGIVRVIMTKNKIADLQPGEILVTAMTTPEYLPAMKKAAAFITDEGGITCHAAIVAREMNKPCVIGTKFATRAFQDGDLVEVDANQGIIRKIDK